MGEVKKRRGLIDYDASADGPITWEVEVTPTGRPGHPVLTIEIEANSVKDIITGFENMCEVNGWQRELTPAEMVALGAKEHNSMQKQIGELTVELKADTKAVNEMLTEMGADIRRIDQCLQVERENADKLAKMLRYVINNDETMKHEILLLGTETTLGDIVDGMLLRHEAIAAARETASE